MDLTLLAVVVLVVVAVTVAARIRARRRALAELKVSGGRKSLMMNLFGRS